jgi:hypothetical protein
MSNIEDLMNIPKFGKTTATRIYNFLRGIN